MKNILLPIALLISLSVATQKMQFGKYYQRTLFFEGNSLFTNNSNSLANNGYYVPITTYNNVMTGRTLVYTSYAITGRTQQLINADLPVNIYPFLKKNDIIVLWEGTNDIRSNGLTGAQAFTNLVTYINAVTPYQPKLIVCTAIARDGTGESTVQAGIDAYNILVRNNAATYGYTVCDLGANAVFDQQADASNTTYYKSDKIHNTTAGQDLEISLITATLNTII